MHLEVWDNRYLKTETQRRQNLAQVHKLISKGLFQDRLMLVSKPAVIAKYLCADQVDFRWHPRSQCFVGGEHLAEDSFESSIVEKWSGHQSTLHPTKANNLFASESPLFSTHFSLEVVCEYMSYFIYTLPLYLYIYIEVYFCWFFFSWIFQLIINCWMVNLNSKVSLVCFKMTRQTEFKRFRCCSQLRDISV